MKDDPRPDYLLRLRPLPRVDGTAGLQRLLKYALRACGLRCIEARTIEHQEQGGERDGNE